MDNVNQNKQEYATKTLLFKKVLTKDRLHLDSRKLNTIKNKELSANN